VGHLGGVVKKTGCSSEPSGERVELVAAEVLGPVGAVLGGRLPVAVPPAVVAHRPREAVTVLPAVAAG
jgi:hypothetical protein